MRFAKRFEKKIIAFDLDGVFLEDNYHAYRDTNKTQPVLLKDDYINLARKLAAEGYELHLFTAREDTPTNREHVQSFLLHNKLLIAFTAYHLGVKPVADLYIDDRGLFDCVETLEAFVDLYFSYDLDSYIDTAVGDMFTSDFSKNISNVPENKDYVKPPTENTFRVLVPLSGGMDSTTIWKMLEEARTPYIPVYFNFGQEYAELEINAAKELVGDNLVIIERDLPYKVHDYILTGRNLAIILYAAKYMEDSGYWGEIWFGNLQGESPVYGGDKSRRFFNTAQHLLTLINSDVRIVNPLIGLNKFDEVTYWKERDVQTLIDTKSCFDAEYNQCGRCQTCFRKYVAFLYHGIDISHTYHSFDIKNFKPYIEKYTKVMGEARDTNNWDKYSFSRVRGTLGAIEKIAEMYPQTKEWHK